MSPSSCFRRPRTIGALAFLVALVLILHTQIVGIETAREAWSQVLAQYHPRPAPVHPVMGRVTGGLPGFWVLENLYYRNYTFYMHGPDLPARETVISRNAGLVDYVTFAEPFDMSSASASASASPRTDAGGLIGSDSDSEFAPVPVPVHTYRGTSMLLMEAARPGLQFMPHYYHFVAETLLGGMAAYGSIGYPHEHSTDAQGRVEAGNVKSGTFVGKETWDELSRDSAWIHFERVIVVDRWSSKEQNRISITYNKMALAVFEHPHDPQFWSAARERMLREHNIPLARPSHKPPRVVYINRQGSRRHLTHEAYEGLMRLLEGLHERGRIEFADVKLEELSLVEQVQVVAHANIMLGMHGNGLTHELWMPSGGTLIELFPPDTFLRDYECVAGVLGHHYVALANDTVLSRETYMGFKGEHNSERVHDGSDSPLHIPTLRFELERALSRLG